jgi:hypothetical protein
MIGLRFLFAGGAFFNVVLPLKEAQEILENWFTGQYKIKNIPRIGVINGDKSWAVQVDSITCIHMMELPPEASKPFTPSPFYKSGI